MKIELEVFTSFCQTSNFSINYVDASVDDFGETKDIDFKKRTTNSGCGNHKFISKEPRVNVLDKYGINESEYYQVCQDLEDKLSFGNCNYCH